MLPLAIFESTVIEPHRREPLDSAQGGPTGFEPVLLQALAAAPRPDARENFSDREVAATPPFDNAQGRHEEVEPSETVAGETEAIEEPVVEEHASEGPAAKGDEVTDDKVVAEPAEAAAFAAEDTAVEAEQPSLRELSPAPPIEEQIVLEQPVTETAPDTEAADKVDENPAELPPFDNAQGRQVAAEVSDQPVVKETPEPNAPAANKMTAAPAMQAIAVHVAEVQAPARKREETATPAARVGEARTAEGFMTSWADKMSAPRVAPPPAAQEALAPRVLEQVQRAMKTLSLRRSGADFEARIALSPPSLGALRLTLRVNDGEISGSVLTDGAAARHVLQTHLPELREALQQQGLTLGQFDIAQGGGNDSFGHAQDRRARDAYTNHSESEAVAAPQVASVVAGQVSGYM